MPNDDETTYRVHPKEGQFLVLNDAGQVVMACHDEGSATHYAVLLNESYQRGYKTGYRAGRRRDED